MFITCLQFFPFPPLLVFSFAFGKKKCKSEGGEGGIAPKPPNLPFKAYEKPR